MNPPGQFPDPYRRHVSSLHWICIGWSAIYGLEQLIERNLVINNQYIIVNAYLCVLSQLNLFEQDCDVLSELTLNLTLMFGFCEKIVVE